MRVPRWTQADQVVVRFAVFTFTIHFITTSSVCLLIGGIAVGLTSTTDFKDVVSLSKILKTDLLRRSLFPIPNHLMDLPS